MKRVLLIEDEELLSSLLQKKLEEQGYEVILATDGQKGIEKVREEHPDLVLLDIILPRLTGLEVLEMMHKEGLTRSIPVIVVSNSGQPVEIDKAKEYGARDWFVKTEFDPDEVIEKVGQYIS